ncbi:MAG: hypothetical protein Q7U53_02545 [Anaerolineaceae bacterium]|nr:hypothetical protein [Anaerolineaceae bacterium]
MQKKSALNWLIPLITMLALVAAGAGILTQGGEGTYTFINRYGHEVEMYGKGLYQFDSRLAGAGFRGTDVVTLLLAIPMLLLSYRHYRRESLRGSIFLVAALFYFLYNGASMTFAASFNSLFLIYVALFSSGTFALIITLMNFNRAVLVKRVQGGFPHRGIAIFLFVAGIGTLFLWISELIGPILQGGAPEIIGPYTTLFTHGFDSALITPAAVMTGIFLLQRKPWGYVLSAPIMIFCTMIGVVVIGQTISQTLEGLVFPVPVYIGMIGSWVVMGAFAVYFTIAYFKRMSND